MKNDCLNVWKGAGAFFIVFIHCSFPSPVGGMMNGLARFAVPLFFMTSGYFSWGKGLDDVRRRLRKVFRLFLISNLIYFLWDLRTLYLAGELTAATAGRLFTPSALADFIFLNQSPFMYHLWFLGALLYCYLFYWLLVRSGKEESCYFLIPLCLILNLILGEGLGILGRRVPVTFARNFWVTGLPFFLWGHWFAARQRRGSLHTDARLSLSAIVAGACLSMGEMLLSGGAELYLGSILMTFGIFTFSLHSPARGRGSLLAGVGERDSLHIYLWQVIIQALLSALTLRLGLRSHPLHEWLMPLAVCLVSWLFAELLVRGSRIGKGRV